MNYRQLLKIVIELAEFKSRKKQKSPNTKYPTSDE